MANDLDELGYPEITADNIRQDARFFAEIRESIKKHAGEEFDVKPFEAGMRHLINSYIEADKPRELADGLSTKSLIELIVESGIHDTIAQKFNAKGKLSKNAVAEGIVNNVRKTIIK